MKFVKDSEGKILSEGEEIKERWRQYFSLLLNTKNERKELEEADKIEGPIPQITREEVKKQLEKMKNGKAAGPDEFPIEIVKKLGDLCLDWITAVLRKVQDEGIPEEWRRSKRTPIYQQKGDPLDCGNYRGIKLLSHCLKLWERVVENRIRGLVKISDRQYGFQPGKSTVQPMFCLRMLQEKMREYQTDLHMVFVNLEKAYDIVPRDLIWYCLRKKSVPEHYVKIIRDMYKNCTTSVTTSEGATEEIDIEVGLHQGSALSSFLFIVILDVISEKIDEKTPWAMLFADDLVICDREGERVEERLEAWHGHLEDAGLKVSRKKIEHFPPKESTTRIRMKRYDQEDYTELPTTNKFNYLGTVIDQDGGCEAEVTRRLSAAWDRWRDLSGVLCAKKSA